MINHPAVLRYISFFEDAMISIFYCLGLLSLIDRHCFEIVQPFLDVQPVGEADGYCTHQMYSMLIRDENIRIIVEEVQKLLGIML